MPGGSPINGALSVTESRDIFAGAATCGASGSLSGTERRDVFLGVNTGALYQVFSNTGIGDAINYGVPIATTACFPGHRHRWPIPEPGGSACELLTPAGKKRTSTVR